MKLSQFAKEENIGRPELFCGREPELRQFLEWIELIPKKQAKSRALMATKKMGYGAPS